MPRADTSKNPQYCQWGPLSVVLSLLKLYEKPPVTQQCYDYWAVLEDAFKS